MAYSSSHLFWSLFLSTLSPQSRPLTESRESLSFDADSTLVLTNLRNALSDVIKGLPGLATKPADVQRVIKVAPAIGWGVYKAATASNPMEVGLYVPKKQAMKQFLSGAKKKGVPAEAIEAAERCLADFEALVQRHASDREVFEAMVADFTDGDRRDAAGMKARKAAFKANVLLWGRQADATVVTSIVHPSANGQSFDHVMIAGTVNQCETRRDMMSRINQHYRVIQPAEIQSTPEFEPIDRRVIDGQPPGLLHDFCSGELPEFRIVGEPGQLSYEQRARDLGRSAAYTLMTGHILRNQQRFSEFSLVSGVSTPSEVLVVHVIMHESLWTKPPLMTLHEPDTKYEMMKHGFGILPLNEQVRYIGRGISSCDTPNVPCHSKMIQHVIDRYGWDPKSFSVFRLWSEYPIVGSRIRLAFKA